MSASAWAVGVDGCPAGWVMASMPVGDFSSARVGVAASFADVLLACEGLGAPGGGAWVLAVDMPIGLLERFEPGGRACDRAARALLGAKRGTSVFAPPTRGALAATTYEQALRRNRAGVARGGAHGVRAGLSKQAYNLFAKLREVDGALAGADEGVRARVHECHPEVSFAVMGGAPVLLPKRTDDGHEARAALLRDAGFSGVAGLVRQVRRARAVAADDVLDALAACWTAQRIARGVVRALPDGPAQTDARGLAMRILA